MQYERNDMNLVRGKFRVRGDTIELHPAYEETAVRIELFGDEIERITRFDALTGELLGELDELVIFPATHYVAGDERMRAGDRLDRGRARRAAPRARGRRQAARGAAAADADRARPRDAGRGRAPARGSRTTAATSTGAVAGRAALHAARLLPRRTGCSSSTRATSRVPQLHGQYAGDRSRKEMLVEHGFRLPSAMDNRPLRFEELDGADQPVHLHVGDAVALRDVGVSTQVVEQIVRPTGLVDPEVVVKPTKRQIDDLIAEMDDRDRRGASGCSSRR